MIEEKAQRNGLLPRQDATTMEVRETTDWISK